MSDPRFYQTSDNFYLLRNGAYACAPLYTVTRVAHRLAKAGATVRMPDGWTFDTLNTWEAQWGWLEVDIRVEAKHARDMTLIGSWLLEDFPEELMPEDIEAIHALLRWVPVD